MQTGNNLLQQLKKEYFWDIDISGLDEVRSSRLIIERVLNFGTLREINLLTKVYSKKHVIDTVCRISYFDPKTMNFIIKLYRIPKTRLKCYIMKQSMPQYWNS